MTDFQITILGSGTSQGVPMIGCECAVCRSRDPRDARTRSSIYVETPEAAWVIDTTPEFRLQCLREGVRRVDAALFTHAHSDHIMGFDDLRRFCERGNFLPVYAGEATMDALRRAFRFAFDPQCHCPGYVKPEPHLVEPFTPFSIGQTTLTPLPMTHGGIETLGFLMERGGRKRAAYLCDCKGVSDAVVERVAGVEHLIVDGLRIRPHPTHLSHEEAAALARRINPGATWFTHICHDIPHATTVLPPGIQLAYDGLKLT